MRTRLPKSLFVSAWEKFAKQNTHCLSKEEFLQNATSFGVSFSNGLLQAYVKTGVIRKNKNGLMFVPIENWESKLYKAYCQSLDERKQRRLQKENNKPTHVPFTYYVNGTYPEMDLHY